MNNVQPRYEGEQEKYSLEVESIKDEHNSFNLKEMGKNDSKAVLSQCSEPNSLDYSPSCSVFESDELDNSTFENDAFEHESGVESVDGDWLQSCNTPPSDFDLDLTEEQALETLKYFTLSVSRANQMTKTTQDLDAVLHLLQEKEKDLELAAHIGHSLLERNKNLYKKTEILETYVNEVEERETQLKHVVTMKDQLLKTFLEDEDMEDDGYTTSEPSPYESCRDETLLSLENKCNQLEENNTNLVLEALKLREQTDKEEEKEKELVYECIRELGETKEQISRLTDEISIKTTDNFEQQEEISQLITTVLDLQERHNQLTEENGELHETLKTSQESQKNLEVEVSTLHEKYQECFEMLMENQREMKVMKEKFGSQSNSDDSASQLPRQSSRDSLALEIEQTVRRDLETSQEKRKHANRVMQTVRAANSTKRFPKAIKAGSRPAKSGAPKSTEKQPFDFTFAATGNSSSSKQPPSMDDLRAAVRRLSISDNASPVPRGRRSWAPEKLQIVKPMEGSATLHKWQSLARPTMSGLHEVHPGVHVKGETSVQSETMTREPTSDTSSDVGPKPKPKSEAIAKTKDEIKTKKEGKAVASDAKSSSPSTKHKSFASPGKGASRTTLTELVKSQLSSEKVMSPESEPGLLLNKILRSSAGISGPFVTSMPVTTTAKASLVSTTTTTTTSTTVSAFPRAQLVRSRSSENLLNLIKPFSQRTPIQNPTSTPSISTDSLGDPNLPQNQGLVGYVGRLVRGSSNENLAGNQTSSLTRSSSSGKISELVKNSNISATIGKSSSFDQRVPNKRASLNLGESPPSSQLGMLDDLGGYGFFGADSSSATELRTSSGTSGGSSTSRSMFGALSGLGGFFRPRSKSMDNLGPLPSSFSASSANVGKKNTRATLVERSLERFNQVFGPD